MVVTLDQFTSAMEGVVALKGFSVTAHFGRTEVSSEGFDSLIDYQIQNDGYLKITQHYCPYQQYGLYKLEAFSDVSVNKKDGIIVLFSDACQVALYVVY